MIAIIDYDNVDQSQRALGLDHVVRKSLDHIRLEFSARERVRVRIYGGWYEGSTLTAVGQRLSAEARRITPVKMVVETNTILCDVELAISPLAAQSAIAFSTFRTRSGQSNVTCLDTPWQSCAGSSECPSSALATFLRSGFCSVATCSVRSENVLVRNEQKIVDTMMVVDTIYASANEDRRVVVVTRDDDIFPGMVAGSLTAAALFHISTARNSRVPSFFRHVKAPPYKRIDWEY